MNIALPQNKITAAILGGVLMVCLCAIFLRRTKALNITKEEQKKGAPINKEPKNDGPTEEEQKKGAPINKEPKNDGPIEEEQKKDDLIKEELRKENTGDTPTENMLKSKNDKLRKRARNYLIWLQLPEPTKLKKQFSFPSKKINSLLTQYTNSYEEHQRTQLKLIYQEVLQQISTKDPQSDFVDSEKSILEGLLEQMYYMANVKNAIFGRMKKQAMKEQKAISSTQKQSNIMVNPRFKNRKSRPLG